MRILIAEDDPFSLTILRLMLESEHCYEIVTARHGGEAWAELERGAGFDLCIFDIMMPEVDGLQLVARMRADPRFASQRVMLCTALNERSVIAQAATLGVSHYIVKPYFKEHVLKQVRRICGEGPGAMHFESRAHVGARLGVDERMVEAFLKDLHRDVAALVAVARSDSQVPAAGSLLLRVNSLKGAAMNLGARTLTGQLAALEDCCIGRAHHGLEPAIAAIESENQRLRFVLGLEAQIAPSQSVAPVETTAVMTAATPAMAAPLVAAS